MFANSVSRYSSVLFCLQRSYTTNFEESCCAVMKLMCRNSPQECEWRQEKLQDSVNKKEYSAGNLRTTCKSHIVTDCQSGSLSWYWALLLFMNCNGEPLWYLRVRWLISCSEYGLQREVHEHLFRRRRRTDDSWFWAMHTVLKCSLNACCRRAVNPELHSETLCW
jgi:hypothetical protein